MRYARLAWISNEDQALTWLNPSNKRSYNPSLGVRRNPAIASLLYIFASALVKLQAATVSAQLEVVELAIEVEIDFLLLEQPEDLGRLAKGPYKSKRPASMFIKARDRLACRSGPQWS